MLAILCILVCISPYSAMSIWDVGQNVGSIPEFELEELNSKEFFDKYHKIPFVVRRFHESLDEIATESGYEDSLEWLRDAIGDAERIDSLEGELRETRLAPTIHRVKWKYFFEKFQHMDMYAVTQAPLGIRNKLKLIPPLSCGGLSSQMAPPHIWVSGGTKASKSVIHADSYLNQHCVLKGSKKFMLIPPGSGINTPDFGWVVTKDVSDDATPGFDDAYGEFAGLVDTDNVDLSKYPGWSTVPWVSTELNEGDCIYMPLGWYHYVESRAEVTVTWHNWFHRNRDYDSSDCVEKEIPTNTCIYKDDRHTKAGKEYFIRHPDRLSYCE